VAERTLISKRDVAHLTDWTARTIERNLQPAAFGEKARNGRPQPLYDLASLPAQAQHKYLKLLPSGAIAGTPAAASARVSSFGRAEVVNTPALRDSQGALTLFANAPMDDAVLAVPEDRREVVAERLASIAPLIDWAAGRCRDFHTLDGRAITTLRALADYIATQRAESGIEQIKGRGLFERYLDWKRGGPAALAGVRSDRGRSRFFREYGAAADFVKGQVAHGNANVALITSMLEREWPALHNHGSVPPSRSTVAAFINTLPRVVRDMVRMPREQFNARHAPHLVTDHTAHRPNEIWVADHRILDIFARNDCFATRDLRAIRVWQTVIQDLRSRAIVGVCFCFTPSSRTIASALRVAISRFGLPDVFYVDNGKDFRKIGKGALSPEDLAALDTDGRITISGEHTGLLARLKIAVRYCTPRHPQAKQIESFFSFQSKRFDPLFGPAYAGRKPHQRSDENAAALKLHKQFLQGKAQGTVLPLASELILMAAHWLEEFNTSYRDHSGVGMGEGKTPYEVFNQLLPEPERRRCDVASIAPLFWDCVKRKVQNCAVEYLNARFEGIDEGVSRQLYALADPWIMLHCDPQNLGEAYAFNLNGQPIGPMRSQQLVAHGPVSRDAVQLMQRTRKRLFRAARETRDLMRAGVPSEYDMLRARAGVIDGDQPQPPRANRELAALPSTTVAPEFPEDMADRWLSRKAVGDGGDE
jgi:hypothetical protein